MILTPISITELLKDPQRIQLLTSQGQGFSVFSRSKLVFSIVPPTKGKKLKTAKNLLKFDFQNDSSIKDREVQKRLQMSAQEEKNYIRKGRMAKYN
ncbi:MAG: hypothetical protein WCK98_02055 [bacterium]